MEKSSSSLRFLKDIAGRSSANGLRTVNHGRYGTTGSSVVDIKSTHTGNCGINRSTGCGIAPTHFQVDPVSRFSSISNSKPASNDRQSQTSAPTFNKLHFIAELYTIEFERSYIIGFYPTLYCIRGGLHERQQTRNKYASEHECSKTLHHFKLNFA